MSRLFQSTFAFVGAAVVVCAPTVVHAADLPTVKHHSTGMSIFLTAEELRHPGPATQPAARTRPAPGDERIHDEVEEAPRVFVPPPFRSTVFWSRANEPWLYKFDSMKYRPKVDWNYTRPDYTYIPKRDWTYIPKRDWTYRPRLW